MITDHGLIQGDVIDEKSVVHQLIVSICTTVAHCRSVIRVYHAHRQVYKRPVAL